jgi:predicted RNA binding protein YcfA (HicA-like mRNA interferase family)
LPQISGREVIRALESAGFAHTSTKGSHAKLRHPDRSLVRGTLGSILRQAGLTAAQLRELLG